MSEALKLKPQIEIKLVIQQGPHAGQRFSFSKKEISIGRSPENDIVLLNDPLISRQHAKVIVVGTDIEVINLSHKNSILVQGEKVQKWKLINDGTFSIGDTEFLIQFDLGQSVVPVRPSPVSLQVVPQAAGVMKKTIPPMSVVTQNSPQSKNTIVRSPTSQQMQPRLQQQPMQKPQQMQQTQIQMRHPTPNQQNIKFQSGPVPPAKLAGILSHPKFRFYLIVAIAGLAAYFYLNSNTDKNKKTEDKKFILKYADEVAIKLNSKSEKENLQKMAKLQELKNSPTTLRAEENFIKGMRDFQLGNYARAQEFFQVVLNLQPSHDLARRHLYLSKVRFDEVLKAKLMLGEINYQKHNFRMCISYYEQVLVMLQGKSSDQNFQLATAMSNKCKLAAEGIR